MITYTVTEAYEQLRVLGLANNLTVFRRWVNKGLIDAIKPENENNYKEGYKITKEAIEKFIEERAPKILELLKENEELKRQPIAKEDAPEVVAVNKELAKLENKVVNLEKENKELQEKLEHQDKKSSAPKKSIKLNKNELYVEISGESHLLWELEGFLSNSDQFFCENIERNLGEEKVLFNYRVTKLDKPKKEIVIKRNQFDFSDLKITAIETDQIRFFNRKIEHVEFIFGGTHRYLLPQYDTEKYFTSPKLRKTMDNIVMKQEVRRTVRDNLANQLNDIKNIKERYANYYIVKELLGIEDESDE